MSPGCNRGQSETSLSPEESGFRTRHCFPLQTVWSVLLMAVVVLRNIQSTRGR